MIGLRRSDTRKNEKKRKITIKGGEYLNLTCYQRMEWNIATVVILKNIFEQCTSNKLQEWYGKRWYTISCLESWISCQLAGSTKGIWRMENPTELCKHLFQTVLKEHCRIYLCKILPVHLHLWKEKSTLMNGILPGVFVMVTILKTPIVLPLGMFMICCWLFYWMV